MKSLPASSARWLLPLLAVSAAGCQVVPEQPLAYGSAVPIYATRLEAQAVAVGQFGAVPVEIAVGPALAVVAVPCGAEVAQVRSRAGRLAWVPTASLPQGMVMPACIETPRPHAPS